MATQHFWWNVYYILVLFPDSLLLNEILIFLFRINYGCLLGLSASDLQWRLPLGLQLVPGIFMTLGMFFLPESVRWLVLR
jgi:hypothetical protein